MSIIQSKIQSLVLNFIDCLASNEALQLEVPRNEGTLSRDKCLLREFDNPATARKYCQLISIAALIGELDSTSKHISQRDLYYALKLLFKSQRDFVKHYISLLCLELSWSFFMSHSTSESCVFMVRFVMPICIYATI